jgi:hypothetical protein
MRHGMIFTAHPWTGSNKGEAVSRARRWMRDGALVLPAGEDELRLEISRFEERVSSAGNLQYKGRGSQHDDMVACILTAALADAAGALPSSPIGRYVRRDLSNLTAHIYNRAS